MKSELTVQIRKNVLETILSKISRKEELEFDEIVEDALLSYFQIKLEDLVGEYTHNGTTFINDVNYGCYIYAFLDSTKKRKVKIGDIIFPYEPFYIGKGIGGRADHLERNERVNERLESIKKKGGEVIVLKIKEDLTNLQSSRLENYFIKSIGRTDLGEGPLLNEWGGIHFADPDLALLELTDLNLERNTNSMILDALNNSKTRVEASRKLGISQRTLARKIEALDIKKGENKKYYFKKQ
jgi:hypothetical protein